jgi:hypothetical protein
MWITINCSRNIIYNKLINKTKKKQKLNIEGTQVNTTN